MCVCVSEYLHGRVCVCVCAWDRSWRMFACMLRFLCVRHAQTHRHPPPPPHTDMWMQLVSGVASLPSSASRGSRCALPPSPNILEAFFSLSNIVWCLCFLMINHGHQTLVWIVSNLILGLWSTCRGADWWGHPYFMHAIFYAEMQEDTHWKTQ